MRRQASLPEVRVRKLVKVESLRPQRRWTVGVVNEVGRVVLLVGADDVACRRRSERGRGEADDHDQGQSGEEAGGCHGGGDLAACGL